MVVFINSSRKSFKAAYQDLIEQFYFNKFDKDSVKIYDEVESADYNMGADKSVTKFINDVVTLDKENEIVLTAVPATIELVQKLKENKIDVKVFYIARDPLTAFLLAEDTREFKQTTFMQMYYLNEFTKMGILKVIKYEDILLGKDAEIEDETINPKEILVELGLEIEELRQTPHLFLHKGEYLNKENIKEKIEDAKEFLKEMQNPIISYINQIKYDVEQIKAFPEGDYDEFVILDVLTELGFGDNRAGKDDILAIRFAKKNKDKLDEIVASAEKDINEIDTEFDIPGYDYDRTKISPNTILSQAK